MSSKLESWYKSTSVTLDDVVRLRLTCTHFATGIELKDGIGQIVFDFNCGGMFHAWVDEKGRDHFEVYHR